MRIVLELQGAQTESRFRGIGRYSLSLAKSIACNRGKHEVIIVLSGLFPETIEPIRAAFDGLLPQENIRVWYAPGPVRECEPGNEWRRDVAERIHEAFLARLDPDIVHVLSLFEGYGDDAVTSIGVFTSRVPTVVTLYDLIPFLNSNKYLDHNSRYKRYYLRKIEYLKRANGFLAISESSAQEAIDAFGFKKSSITSISAACDPMFKRMDIDPQVKNKFLRRFNLSRPFVMYCSGVDYTKNLPRLLLAYSKLIPDVRKEHQLLITGKIPEENVRELKAIVVSAGLRTDELVLTGYVRDEELVQLYNLCKLFVIPSLHEGFGLPALEAMSCGAPVIGANTTSLPEVIGWDDALFDPWNIKSISKKITDALTDESFRKDLILHGVEQAKKFSWDESARQAISVFEKISTSKLSKTVCDFEGSVVDNLVDSISKIENDCFQDKDLASAAYSIALNHVRLGHKQLFVDISELVWRDAKSGIQRVTRSILKELLENPPQGFHIEPVYGTVDQPGYRYARNFTLRFLNGFADGVKDEFIEIQPGDVFLGLDLQHHVVIAQKDYLLQLLHVGVQVFFVVYDLLPVLLPHAFLPGTREIHEQWLKIITRFNGVIGISNAVARELSQWMNANPQEYLRSCKIDFFHLGVNIENSVPMLDLSDNAAEVLGQLARRPSFLIVGTLEPRKGYAQTLLAFEWLWAQGIDVNFVIVGKQGWHVEALVDKLRRHTELGKRLFWLEGISDEYLEKVYAASSCLIAASEGEGFGLPLIEAAQHKLPIIARDIPVFREVAGEHAFYFSGLEPQNLAEAINNWLMLNAKGKAPQSTNIPWLTWQQSTQQLLEKILPGVSRCSSQSMHRASSLTKGV